MIQITNKRDCCGCWACVQRCPKQCISMREDEEGFLYPKIDISLCINCGLCEKVCPVLNLGISLSPLKVYVAKSLDEQMRKDSSSGGIFTLLAESIISRGGVVFGARFNENWDVIHDYTETIQGLADFRGSKYLQSQIGNTFSKVEQFLKQGRCVLFSGTPCQVAGLKRFLRIPYDNLFLVDFICHGVPSPRIWKQYLSEAMMSILDKKVSDGKTQIEKISFRDKSMGWKRFSFSLVFSCLGKSYLIKEPSDKNEYLKGFLANLYLRPSCYHCETKGWSSGSDITIADAWGINSYMPDFDDDKGCSLVSILSPNGLKYFNSLCETERLRKRESSESFIRQYNPAAFVSAVPHKKRNVFFKNIRDKKDFYSTLKMCLPEHVFLNKVIWHVKRFFSKS